MCKALIYQEFYDDRVYITNEGHHSGIISIYNYKKYLWYYNYNTATYKLLTILNHIFLHYIVLYCSSLIIVYC